jgi:predicted nucleic acid-binding protein
VHRVFIDTNVLFPFSVMDLLLGLSEDSVHTVVWSDALLDEWERVIVREQRRTQATAASLTTAIREFFADSKIDLSAYEHLIAHMPGNDPDDHHHMAAAIAGHATVLITENIKDFPTEPLAQLGLRVARPDAYLCELLADLPDQVTSTIERIAAEKRKPTRTTANILDALHNAGLKSFSQRARQQFGPAAEG